MVAQVVFNLPINRAFDYAIPDAMRSRVQPGMRVVAPFGHRRLVGMVVRLQSRSRLRRRLKTLLRVLDAAPVLPPEGFELARWIADYYYCSLGEACASIVPSALRIRPPRAAAPARMEPALPAVPARAEEPPLQLTEPQQAAWNRMAADLSAGRHETFLVHGVTGSGKTELYLRAVDLSLSQGKAAVVLVPEIALTPQTIDRFRQRFGEAVALWHSRVTARQRAQTWQELLEGRRRVVVGTRSAVFAPVAPLGVIILDEEHDPSYKQDDVPRYHARDVARERARRAGAPLILGSATPSIESYFEAVSGRAQLLELPERVAGRPLPAIELIDMREELGARHRLLPLSRRLQRALERVVQSNEQAILLLNRRGFARTLMCPVCGTVVRCAQCDVPMVYHAQSSRVRCHYCNAHQPPPETCPACHKGYVRFRGAGTERIESELHRLFPASGIGRMDRDTTTGRDSHRQLYEAIKTHQVDLMVGTQMVAKGWDLPQVTVVGVISADTALNLPDFRAGERTFDLLTQVAGRAGRGERPGQVFIQTYCPTHYAIQAAARHDYRGFFQAELQMRQRLQLPPAAHLVELTVQGSTAARVQAAAEALAEALRKAIGRRGIVLLGPSPHRIARVRRLTRWHVILRAAKVPPIVEAVRKVLGQSRQFKGLPVLVDVDPL